MVASTYTKLKATGKQMIRLLEALEDCDDTQNVYSTSTWTRTDGTPAERAPASQSKRPPGSGGLFLGSRNF